MRIVERIKSLNRLKRRGLLLFAVAIIIICFSTGYRDIEMNIYYNSYPQNATVTQVCWDTGKGFSADEVSTQAVEPVTKLVVDKSYAGKLKNIRIDFVDSSGAVNVNQIVIKRQGLVLGTYRGQELIENLFPLNDIEVLGDEAGDYVVKCTSVDGYVGCSSEFVTQINSLFEKQPIEYVISAIIGVLILVAIAYFMTLEIFSWERLLILAAGVVTFIFIAMYDGISGSIQMEIVYKEYPENSNMVQLLIDMGEYPYKYQVITEHIAPITRFEISQKYTDKISKLRIDFTDSQGKIAIEKIRIKKNGIILKDVRSNELSSMLCGLSDLELEETGHTGIFEMNSVSDDGYAWFTVEFVKVLNEYFYVQRQERYSAIVLLALSLILLWNRKLCMGFIAYWCTKLDDLIEKRITIKKIFIVSGIFFLGVLYCYRNYIVGNAVFVFRDIAGDSINQSFPNQYHYADLISKGEWIFGWDFAEGMGAVKRFGSVTIFDWPILFGTKALPYLLGISQIIKIVLAYIIMYFYLRTLKRREITSHIGAMSYALCGYMMVRQYWKSYPNIVVLTALVLLCMEIAISKKKFKWLPVALFVYCISFNSYNTCLMFAMMVGYTLFRYFQLNDTYKMKELVLLTARAVSAYIVAIFASALVVLPSLAVNLGGSRFKEGTQSVKERLLSLTSPEILKTAFFRTISNDWLGFDQYFVGWDNILISPSFYCGILLLVLVPLAVMRQKKGRKISSVVAIGFILAYTFLPGLNYLMNGFSEVSFRLSSIWVFYVIIYLGTLGMDIWIAERSKQKMVTLSTLFCIMIMATALSIGTEYFDAKIYVRTIGILLMFAFLVLTADRINKNVFYCIMVLLVSIDLFSNAYIFCDTPIKVTEGRLSAYRDETVDHIKEMDGNSLYRIEKSPKVYYCDSLYQNFYGTNQYSGQINDDLYKFYSKLNIPVYYESSRHFLSGLNNSNSLYSLLGVKYIIPEAVIDNNYGLDLSKEIDGTYINNKVLPIGFCYDNIINYEDFESLGISEKRKAILDSCVLQAEELIYGINIKNAWDYNEHLQGNTVSYVYDEADKAIYFDTINADKVVVLDFITQGINDMAYSRVYYGNIETEIGTTYISSAESDKVQHLELCGFPISYIKMDSSRIMNIRDIKISAYDKDLYYEKLDEYIENRRLQSFDCKKFAKNRIEGSVKNDKNSILFFSIPYDIGWNIYVDGTKSELMKVNYGFIGTYLPAGDHDVVLQYRMPYLNISAVITIIGLAAMIVWFVYWRKREKGDNASGENISCGTSVQ
ncbi:MAG: YfhO family protein [Lachnospiraceae bacterium]|nr:YfhO family protein [Lachnospiraceae bacterium]